VSKQVNSPESPFYKPDPEVQVQDPVPILSPKSPGSPKKVKAPPSAAARKPNPYAKVIEETPLPDTPPWKSGVGELETEGNDGDLGMGGESNAAACTCRGDVEKVDVSLGYTMKVFEVAL